ncbi:substrate import-associated zinc metallohydrolase lipoprotein [uncultured Polaribacter sp.]|uniref:substrate import-associated zinc metallohydrolase lipoprotein n=1 Tax=uncultured Polaribacter sp. TaxID=174711 RepID=UPI00260A8FCE|nr:substrate import-associated zinc metallohydrolase lipoprotein [uncultured Polaribacter sp.]
MKKIHLFIAILISGLFYSCNSSEEKLTESNIDTTTPNLNATDIWLRTNYTFPFNIDVTYQWDEGRVDLNRYLFPPTLETVIPIMEAVKTIWIDTYTEVGGEDFVKNIAPRELVLIGGFNLNENGTRTLGFAEGGKNIVLFEADLIDLTNQESITLFVRTIQHEYTHILNQQFRFDEEAYKQITPGDYTAQWFNPGNESERFDIAYKLGFISDYARLNHTEDFAEMVATMLSNSPADYQALLDTIKQRIIDAAIRDALLELPNTATDLEREIATNAATLTATPDAEEAIDFIKQKEALVADYFLSKFKIDIYELQRVAALNVAKATLLN